MRRSIQLNKDKQHIMVRKRELKKTLNFFSCFNMLVRWVTYKLRLPCKRLKIGARKHLQDWFSTPSLPCYVSPSTPLKTRVVSSLPPVVSAGGRDISFRSLRICAQDFEPCLFFFLFFCFVFFQVILNYHECFGLTIQKFFFIYLFIHSFTRSFNFTFLWIVQLRYINNEFEKQIWKEIIVFNI